MQDSSVELLWSQMERIFANQPNLFPLPHKRLFFSVFERFMGQSQNPWLKPNHLGIECIFFVENSQLTFYFNRSSTFQTRRNEFNKMALLV